MDERKIIIAEDWTTIRSKGKGKEEGKYRNKSGRLSTGTLTRMSLAREPPPCRHLQTLQAPNNVPGKDLDA